MVNDHCQKHVRMTFHPAVRIHRVKSLCVNKLVCKVLSYTSQSNFKIVCITLKAITAYLRTQLSLFLQLRIQVCLFVCEIVEMTSLIQVTGEIN